MKASNLYFDWLVRKVATGEQADDYYDMLYDLYSVEFRYNVQKDSNRVFDALEMRREFNKTHKEYDGFVSVLEILVAMSCRCEDRLMGDYDKPDRTSEWFWTMMSNCKLARYDDDNYDQNKVLKSIDIFLDRRYQYDGSRGGLFVIKDCGMDMRKVDLWQQMMWHMSRIIDNEKGEY